MLMHHLASSFDVKAILFASLVLQGCALLVLLKLSRPLVGPQAPTTWYLVLTAVMLSFAPYTNILWGFQTAWYLVTLLLMLSLLSLERAAGENDLRWLFVGAVAAVLASFCSAQGLAVWIAGAAYLAVRSGGLRRSLPTACSGSGSGARSPAWCYMPSWRVCRPAGLLGRAPGSACCPIR
jgi:hypothetical protein